MEQQSTTFVDAQAAGSPVVPAVPEPTNFEASNAYRNYVVWLLSGVYLLNIMDRGLLATLTEPIRVEFGLNDTSMGFLGGLAFVVLYSFLGIPLARVADRGNRVNLIAISIVAWSAFTAMTGLAKNFWHLLLARIGVGIGEAGCNPAAYSILGDYFELKRRATALSIYNMGGYAGTFLGTAFAAQIAQTYGWRMAFYVVGLPGLVIAIVLKLTLREPPRGFSDPVKVVHAAPPAMTVLKSLLGKSSFRHLALAAALHNFVVYGAGNFYATFFIRTHQMPIAEVGAQLGLVVLIGGVGGTYLGGWISDRFATRRKDARYYLWVPAWSLILAFPIAELAFFVDSENVALWLLIPAIVGSSAYLAPSITATYSLVGLRERALASAVLLFILNMIGLGLGPLLVGVTSDLFRQYFVEQGVTPQQALADGLRWALHIAIVVNLWSAVHYFIAARTLRQEMIKT